MAVEQLSGCTLRASLSAKKEEERRGHEGGMRPNQGGRGDGEAFPFFTRLAGSNALHSIHPCLVPIHAVQAIHNCVMYCCSQWGQGQGCAKITLFHRGCVHRQLVDGITHCMILPTDMPHCTYHSGACTLQHFDVGMRATKQHKSIDFRPPLVF